nr:GMC family oxidoreductase N-terminal domain-containing protein [Streptomyces antimycoticus]
MMSDFHYIVVGAGSAGAVVAARLPEIPDTRVLLLEAGRDDAAEQIHDPTAWFTLIGGEHDWGYTTVPQTGLAGHPQAAARGKVLGGSSSINAMTYVRGHLGTFDAWAADGCTGWDAASALEIFRAIEHTEGRDRRFRGTGGPLRLNRGRPPAARPGRRGAADRRWTDHAVDRPGPHRRGLRHDRRDGRRAGPRRRLRRLATPAHHRGAIAGE